MGGEEMIQVFRADGSEDLSAAGAILLQHVNSLEAEVRFLAEGVKALYEHHAVCISPGHWIQYSLQSRFRCMHK